MLKLGATKWQVVLWYLWFPFDWMNPATLVHRCQGYLHWDWCDLCHSRGHQDRNCRHGALWSSQALETSEAWNDDLWIFMKCTWETTWNCNALTSPRMTTIHFVQWCHFAVTPGMPTLFLDAVRHSRWGIRLRRWGLAHRSGWGERFQRVFLSHGGTPSHHPF